MKNFIVLLLLSAGCFLCGGESYRFFMISDTHFGAADTFYNDPNGPKKYRTKKDIHRADKVMHLYEALFADIAKKAEKNSFVIEAGDLIEGKTHGEETHKKVLADALALMKKHFKMPIYMVNGNHEAAGKGGGPAYRAVLLPEIAKYAGKEALTSSDYFIWRGNDLYIFLDHYSKNRLNFLRRTLQDLKRKPRYLFLIMHAPPLTANVFGKNSVALFELLSQYNAVVLAGHTHQTGVTKFEKNGKSFHQVTVLTLIPNTKSKTHRMRDASIDAARLKNEIINRARARKSLNFTRFFEEKWAPFITEHKRFFGAGYAEFHVSDNGITVSFQGADLISKPVTVELLKNNRNK